MRNAFALAFPALLWLVRIGIGAEFPTDHTLGNGQRAGTFFTASFKPVERENYLVMGKVTWDMGHADLAEHSEIACLVSMAPVGDLRASLKPGNVTKPGDLTETWLTFAIGSNGYAGAAFVTEWKEKGPAYSLRLLSVHPSNPENPKVQIVRTISLPKPHEGEWTLRYHLGVLTLLRDGKTVLVGDSGLQEQPVLGVRLRQALGTARVFPFQVAALSPPPALTPKQDTGWQVSHANWLNALRNVGKALGASDWSAAHAASQEEAKHAAIAFGQESLAYIQALRHQGLAELQLYRFTEASATYQRALELCLKRVGENHPETARILSDWASVENWQGHYAQAIENYQRASKTMTAILGEANAETALNRASLAGVYVNAKLWPEAVDAYESALASQVQVFGETSENVAHLRGGYATPLEETGRMPDAIAQLQEALTIHETRGPGHAETLKARLDLAKLQRKAGDMLAARQNLDRILEDTKGSSGSTQDAGERAAFELAIMAANLGDQDQAESLLQEAEARHKARKSQDHLTLAHHLSERGSVLEVLGQYREARDVYREAERLYARDGSATAALRMGLLINLPMLEADLGNFAEAKSQAVRLIKELEGTESNHVDLAMAHSIAGFVDRLNEDYPKAAESYAKAAALVNRAGQSNASHLASCWISQAECLSEYGEFGKARKLIDRALDLIESRLGPKHSAMVRGYHSKGGSFQSEGDWKMADELYRRAFDLEWEISSAALGGLSDHEAIKLSSHLQALRSDRLALSRSVRNRSPEDLKTWLKSWPEPDARKEYEIVWRTKGLATELVLGRRAIAVSRSPSETSQKLSQVRQRLAKLYFSAEDELDLTSRAKLLADAAAERELLERKLAEELGTNIARAESAPEDLFRVLPANSAVIDFVEVVERSPRLAGSLPASNQRFYEAYILRPSKTGEISVVCVDLGDAGPMDQSVLALGRVNGQRGLTPLDPHSSMETQNAERLASEISTAIWAKLKPRIAGAENIFIVPDGKLHLVPWAGLPDPDNPEKYLVEDHCFVTASFAQQWLSPPPEREKGPSPWLLLGNVDFGSETTRWNALPGTKREIDAISKLASSSIPVIRLEKQAATPEALLKEAPTCRGIHLATHGFFHRAPATQSIPRSLEGTIFAKPSGDERNPLLRCGLALAGANAASKGQGVLDGEGMLSANLTGVDLVVLSACETHVGVDSGGEGLFALQRAFQMAGARSVAASLWSVDDDATAVFMEEFYRELWKNGLSKKDALRRAQLSLLVRYDPKTKRLRTDEEIRALPRPLPMYWAAFSLSGDWR